MLQTSALQPGQELDRPERVGPLGSQGHGGCAGWCVDFATLSSFSCVNIGCCSICYLISFKHRISRCYNNSKLESLVVITFLLKVIRSDLV